jgi:hypothetical protein
LPLDLGYRTNNDDHGPPKRASGIYVFAQADKLDAEMIEFVEHFQEVTHVPRYTVEGSDEHNIKTSTPRIGHHLVKAGTLRFRAAHRVCVLADDLVTALPRHLAQVEKLCLQVLVLRANTCIEDGSLHFVSLPHSYWTPLTLPHRKATRTESRAANLLPV